MTPVAAIFLDLICRNELLRQIRPSLFSSVFAFRLNAVVRRNSRHLTPNLKETTSSPQDSRPVSAVTSNEPVLEKVKKASDSGPPEKLRPQLP